MSVVTRQKTFRFLELPTELRLRIYRYIIPKARRVILDPDCNTPLLFGKVEAGLSDVITLLTLCRKTYLEAGPLVFRENTVTINNPMGPTHGDVLGKRGTLACQNIVKMDIKLYEGLADLARMWQTLIQLPSLVSLKLILYHSRRKWLATLCDIASARADKTHYTWDLQLELFTSIWAEALLTDAYRRMIQTAFVNARDKSVMYPLQLPNNFKKLIVSASVGANAAYAFATYKDTTGFRFNSDGSSDTNVMKRLEWQE